MPFSLNIKGLEEDLVMLSKYFSRWAIVSIPAGNVCSVQSGMWAYPKNGALLLKVSSTFIVLSLTTLELNDLPSMIMISPARYSTGPMPYRSSLFEMVSRSIMPESSPFHITFFISPMIFTEVSVLEAGEVQALNIEIINSTQGNLYFIFYYKGAGNDLKQLFTTPVLNNDPSQM